MKRRIIFGIGILIVVGAIAGAIYYVKAQAAPAPNTLRVSGTIEAENIIIAAEVPGRIVAINAEEGAQVKTGEALVQLDTALIDGQIVQAQAALELAQANLAQVKAAARPELIHAAEGALAQATAAREGVKQAWLDAQEARDNPQELDAQIDAARAALAVAEADMSQAEGLAGAASAGYDELDRAFDAVNGGIIVRVQTPQGLRAYKFKPSPAKMSELRTQHELAGKQTAIAFEGIDVAKAARDAAQADLDNMFAIRANPLEANARVDLAFAQYQASAGALTSAQAKLNALQAGATKEEVAATEAQVAEAQAALNTLQVQKSKMTLMAPRDAYVVERLANRGELATPNAPLLKLTDLDALTMTVYLPTNELGSVRLGTPVQVSVDGFAGRRFDGKVTFISPDAEFTPTNAQTQDARTNLVYAVNISLGNDDHRLKPGLAGDVEFSPVVEQ